MDFLPFLPANDSLFWFLNWLFGRKGSQNYSHPLSIVFENPVYYMTWSESKQCIFKKLGEYEYSKSKQNKIIQQVQTKIINTILFPSFRLFIINVLLVSNIIIQFPFRTSIIVIIPTFFIRILSTHILMTLNHLCYCHMIMVAIEFRAAVEGFKNEYVWIQVKMNLNLLHFWNSPKLTTRPSTQSVWVIQHPHSCVSWSSTSTGRVHQVLQQRLNINV